MRRTREYEYYHPCPVGHGNTGSTWVFWAVSVRESRDGAGMSQCLIRTLRPSGVAAGSPAWRGSRGTARGAARSSRRSSPG